MTRAGAGCRGASTPDGPASSRRAKPTVASARIVALADPAEAPTS
ncbi:MAG TPA: hypothetical protein VHZ54_13620 [Solirubrobacterales bacterium]|nr:hypothetical protein [Solirubrobacterales bacterium]